MIDLATAVFVGSIVAAVSTRSTRSPRRPVDQITPPRPSRTAIPDPARRLVELVARGRNRRRLAQQQFEVLPVVIDTISVVVSAGGSITDALRVLSTDGPVATAPPFAEAARLRSAGIGVGPTLRHLMTDLHDGFRPMLTTLAAADRDGAPLAMVLARLSEEARSARRTRAEVRARQLPVRLIFPLVTCFLPAVIIGAVVPLVFVSFDRFG